MSVDFRIHLEATRVRFEGFVDIPGSLYSDRRMAWLRREVEEYIINLVETQLPHLKWDDTP